jgi:aspartyl-tRNA(Asn)/glutamyl-tRNA(Gln) amidotransferase subunit A
MHNATLAELSRALAERRVSSLELAKLCLDRIERFNPRLNAFITVDPERALAAAAAADARRAKGGAGRLDGVPVAHKDIFLTEGWRTTCGSRILENFVAPYESHVTGLLAAAGMVTVGKLNMDEFAMGSSNETSYFGPVRNPWDETRVPGGSSGGSVAAVAARLVPAATGTDTGGSIRQPAAFTSLVGLKPTYGLCSRYGMIAFASSLDQAGPITRTAEDCALVLSAMTGHDPRDSTSLDRPAQDYTLALGKPLAGLRIGLPKEYFPPELPADIGDALERALAEFRRQGAVTVEVSVPNVRHCIPAYYVIAPAEASSNLSRFDGVRYGHRAAQYRDLLDMYKKTRAEGFGEEVKRRILIGTYVLSHGYYDAYYLQAQKLRRLIADDFRRVYREVDVVVGPSAPSTAFPLGDKADDPLQMYLNDIFTIAANLAGLPGMSVPCGFDRSGLPIGMQIMGDYFGEATMLNAAHQYQLATDWHTRGPAAYTG